MDKGKTTEHSLHARAFDSIEHTYSTSFLNDFVSSDLGLISSKCECYARAFPEPREGWIRP